MLVSYGSDSNSDDGLAQPTAPLKATPPVPEASSSKPKGLGGLDLPPPKAKASKKEKGPVKIQLTDVSSSNVDAAYQHNDEPAKKRPKLGLGSGGGKSGLVGMLPAPKKDTVKPSASGSSGPSAAPAALSTTQDAADPLPQEDPVTLMMMPKAVKRKQPPAPTEEPAQDMFGLSSLGSSTSAATISSTSATPSSIRKTLSAAPTIAEKPRQNFYATLGPATPDNPYPGFHCIPETGQWEPDRPDEWSEWAALHGYAQSAQASSSSQAQGAAGQAPRGFEGASQANMAEVSFKRFFSF